jgi:hypothetical protein
MTDLRPYMNNSELLYNIVKLQDISKIVINIFGDTNLASDINNCAERLHFLATGCRISDATSDNHIKKVTE